MELESHPEMVLLTPLIAITAGECSDETCSETHWRFSIGWLVWSIHFYF